MKKIYNLEDLDCAACAAKMERAIQKIAGVNSANINFMAQKLTVDAADNSFEAVIDTIVKICHHIEPDCRIIR